MKPRTRLLEFFTLCMALLFLAPVVLIFLTAFKPESEIIHFESILPQRWTLDNFRTVLGNAEEIPILRWFFNSFLISGSVTFLVLAVSSLSAFALARLHPPGKRWFFPLLIATMMVPGQILLVPVYLILNTLGWLDTPLALIIPAGAGAFGVFLLHQFFVDLPKELEESAAIDGATPFQVFWYLALPMARPALSTLGIFTFIGSWNDFLAPLVFLDSLDRYTLPVGIALFQTSYASDYGLTFAVSVFCTLPVIIVFLVFQKQIIQGMSHSGLKE
jgi:multiple sugar transport system permease protein